MDCACAVRKKKDKRLPGPWKGRGARLPTHVSMGDLAGAWPCLQRASHKLYIVVPQ